MVKHKVETWTTQNTQRKLVEMKYESLFKQIMCLSFFLLQGYLLNGLVFLCLLHLLLDVSWRPSSGYGMTIGFILFVTDSIM